jgi:crotonobetainyl-CoA:carnitine CoA-transferase CaiB-like acyl-CoA transferase
MLTDERFQTFNDRMGHYHDLAKILEGEFMLLPATEWEDRLIARDVPFAPVLSVDTYRSHPQVQWLDVQEPVRDGVGLVRVPWRFAGERPRRSAGTPRIGEDSRSIAGEVYDEDRVGALIASGVLDAGRDQ